MPTPTARLDRIVNTLTTEVNSARADGHEELAHLIEYILLEAAALRATYPRTLDNVASRSASRIRESA
jgi:hypothetical protein